MVRWYFVVGMTLVLICSLVGWLMLMIGDRLRPTELSFLRVFQYGVNSLYLSDIERSITLPIRFAFIVTDYTWSPNGQCIAVVSSYSSIDGTTYMFDRYGDFLFTAYGLQPAFSPNGRWLVTTSEDMRVYGIYLYDTTDSNNWRRLTEEYDVSPAWSPDGQYIAFVRSNNGLYIVPPDGTSSPRYIADSEYFSWSPDSRSLIFTSNLYSQHDLYRIDIYTGDEQPLVISPRDELYPTFSLDGTRLAYIGRESFREILSILEPDRSIVEFDLTALLGRQIHVSEPPLWSPDGRQIILTLTDSTGNSSQIYLFSLMEERIELLTSEGQNELRPAWRP